MTAGTSSNTPKSNTRTHLPSHKGKHAPRVFTGCFDKVAQFFEELEGTCDKHNMTDPKEKCEAVVRYSNKEVVKDIKGLREYHDGDYEALKREMQQLQPSLYKSCVNNPEHIYKTSLLT